MDTSKKIKNIVSLLIGFSGMIASGLNWNVEVAAWLFPVFTLYYVRNSKKLALLLLFIIAIIAGIISRTCFAVSDNSISTHISHGILYAIPFIIAFIIDKWLYVKKSKFYFTLIYPFSVVLLEYITSTIVGTWGVTAHTMNLNNPLVQFTSITGLFSLSFIIAWFGSIINWIIEHQHYLKTIKNEPAIYLSILIIMFAFGLFRKGTVQSNPEKVKVAALSGNTNILKIFQDDNDIFHSLTLNPKGVIPQRIFSTETNIDVLLSNTQTALQNKAKIIVWNEYALILSTEQQNSLIQKVCNLAKEYQAYILISFLGEANSNQQKPFNNKSILITNRGKVTWEYLKSGLHPEAEEPFINKGTFKVPYLDTEYGRIGNLICYDMDIIKLSRQAGKNNIDIMLLPSYDWDGITPLHANMAGFEAIQNGFLIIRPDGNGYSTVYNSKGQLLANSNMKHYDSGILYAYIPIESKNTFFSKTGNIFVGISIIFLLFILIMKVLKIKT